MSDKTNKSKLKQSDSAQQHDAKNNIANAKSILRQLYQVINTPADTTTTYKNLVAIVMDTSFKDLQPQQVPYELLRQIVINCNIILDRLEQKPEHYKKKIEELKKHLEAFRDLYRKTYPEESALTDAIREYLNREHDGALVLVFNSKDDIVTRYKDNPTLISSLGPDIQNVRDIGIHLITTLLKKTQNKAHLIPLDLLQQLKTAFETIYQHKPNHKEPETTKVLAELKSNIKDQLSIIDTQITIKSEVQKSIIAPDKKDSGASCWPT